MRLRSAAIAFAAAIGVSSSDALAALSIQSVEFFGMPAPCSPREKASIYSRARMSVLYADGTKDTFDLVYQQLAATTDVVNGRVVGGLYDAGNRPLMEKDSDVQMASDGPDGTSLLDIPGMTSRDPTRRSLAMVVNFEYRALPPRGSAVQGSHWGRLPSIMGMGRLEQDLNTGALKLVDYSPVRVKDGNWLHCGSTMSAWNTHIGSEEYEPDARIWPWRDGGRVRLDPKKADQTDPDFADVGSFSRYCFGDSTAANPYDYGFVPEVTVHANFTASVTRHLAPGRISREMMELASDDRTAISGDDGKNTGLFMFVAERARDLSAGTLYAARAVQRDRLDLDLEWIRLGHATDKEIASLVKGGITFEKIFDASVDSMGPGYRKVIARTGIEWLKLKAGMERAAAFLETRRYAAYLGATTEFSKMEYVAYNDRDRKFYLAISKVEAGMADSVGDIHYARNDGGMILEMSTAKGPLDTEGHPIPSDFVGTRLAPIAGLVGGWHGDAADAEGNRCDQDRICGPDNLRYAESIRTLFVGEDTSRRNNNYVWAFNIDGGKLSRILSAPMGAEASGLTVVPNYNGHAYIMSNFQHPGEYDIRGYTGDDRAAVLDSINVIWGARKKAAIGYIGTKDGALPALE